MDTIDFEPGVASALDSIVADRLVLVLGAGLSMAPPSSLPSAATIAADAKSRYDEIYGGSRPPLPDGIEEQAEYFYGRDELATVYLSALVDPSAFSGRHNPGHEAVADFLLVGAARAALSFNVDLLIENAGEHIYGHVESALDGDAISTLPPTASPLLKAHGCWRIDRRHTVWAPSQTGEGVVADRIEASTRWLRTHLLNRDLLVVGFFTDWSYLNDVVGRTLGEVNPARVTVVDPCSGSDLMDKAPHLYDLGSKPGVTFQHVQASGADFLDALRSRFSESYVRRVLRAGRGAFETEKGVAPDAAWLEPSFDGASALWQVRRDLEGCAPRRPATERGPTTAGALLGLTLLKLQAAGATASGTCWQLAEHRVRVVNAPNQPLHEVQATYDGDTAPVAAPDVVVAVGAEDAGLPANIARARTEPTIARGSAARWVTRQDADAFLNL